MEHGCSYLQISLFSLLGFFLDLLMIQFEASLIPLGQTNGQMHHFHVYIRENPKSKLCKKA